MNPTTYIHKLTGAEFIPVTVGPKVILLKCTREGTSNTIKVGGTTKTNPTALKLLYSLK